MNVQDMALEKILLQAKQLPSSTRLQLVKDVLDTIQVSQRPMRHQPLVYGRFRGPEVSTEADFEIAEWRPTDGELDGD